MTRPTFQWQLSLGNVIQIALLLLAAGIGWATFDARISANEKSMAAMAASQAALEARMRVVENNYARTDERLSSILSMLSKIDNRLERIEQVRR